MRILKYKDYITEVLNIELKRMDKYRNQILEFKALRNTVGHSDDLNPEDKKRIEMIKNIKGVELISTEDGQIRIQFITDQFLKDFIIIIKKTLNEVYNVQAKP